MVDLHRHDEFSTFDGFGKASELAELAKSLGHTSFSTTNHGNVNGLVKHYQACKKAGIRCIMGVEAYFQPVFDKEKPRYHLCLFAKNLKGYQNLNRLMYRAEKQKHYKPILTFKDLEEFSEGIICSSACVEGFLSKAILASKLKLAEKAAERFKSIYGNDFYIEIQPYKIDEEGTQERVNFELVKIADNLGIECILTSDSHYGRKEDFETYKKMHEIAKHNYDIEKTYGERYMPTEKELVRRYVKMHGDGKYKVTTMRYVEFMKNLERLEDKFEQDILDELEIKLPEFLDSDSTDSFEKLVNDVKSGLREKGRYNKKYAERCKEELRIIKMHGFADYFLIVADYVKFAKDSGITVGPGRGSVCNSEVAYALGITEVDSIKFNLDFRRFLRADKKKMPDIDLDFETSRRQEVIDYLIKKYKGHSAQVCSYGLYKTDNLVNDLAKVCGLDDKDEIKTLKSYLSEKVDESGHFDYEEDNGLVEMYNSRYDNIVYHFSKLYGKVRYIGTHAAGVAITGSDIKNYCAIRVTKDKDTGIEREYTAYDLADLEGVCVIKFDMLGLRTMESLGELRRLTGNDGLTDEVFGDERILKAFRDGETDGIFQFEKSTPKKILANIQCDCFEDIIAASSMNRPGPLSMKMPDTYAYNKFHAEEAKKGNPYYEFTKETYGTVVYQEQLQLIATEIGKLSWKDADRLMKLMKGNTATVGDLEEVAKEKEEMAERFVKGAMENGFSEEDARKTFQSMLAYVFNKGHSTGYSMISLEEMYYKIYHPTEYWYTKMKYCNQNEEGKLAGFKEQAVVGGAVVFLPHVNYTANYSLRNVDGDRVIQEGLCSMKGVGEKAAIQIERERRKNGPYVSYDDFVDRNKFKGSSINKRVIEILKEQGALEFDKKKYIKRVTKYNSALYMRGNKK